MLVSLHFWHKSLSLGIWRVLRVMAGDDAGHVRWHLVLVLADLVLRRREDAKAGCQWMTALLAVRRLAFAGCFEVVEHITVQGGQQGASSGRW